MDSIMMLQYDRWQNRYRRYGLMLIVFPTQICTLSSSLKKRFGTYTFIFVKKNICLVLVVLFLGRDLIKKIRPRPGSTRINQEERVPVEKMDTVQIEERPTSSNTLNDDPALEVNPFSDNSLREIWEEEGNKLFDVKCEKRVMKSLKDGLCFDKEFYEDQS